MENETSPVPSVPGACAMSPSIAKLALALSKAQMGIKGAVRDSENSFFKSSYADLAATWDACHAQLNENELAVVQMMEPAEPPRILMVTYLIHSSGEWMKSFLAITPKANDPQGVGSAITYARRYALAAIAGVCPIDDDGEAAMGRNDKHAPPAPASSATLDRLMAAIVSSSDPSKATDWIAGLHDGRTVDELSEAEAQKVIAALDKRAKAEGIMDKKK